MNKAARQKNTRRSVPRLGAPVQGRRIVTKCLHATADGLLLVQTAAEPLWRYFWPVASVDLPGGVGGVDTDQYAPLALVLLGAFFLDASRREKVRIVLVSVVLLLAVGVFDAITWNAGLFHSYFTNIYFNLELVKKGIFSYPAYQYLW